MVVRGRRARQHVERGLRHVRVRVPGGLEPAVELALDGRHVDDVLVALGRLQHQRLQPRVQDERRDGVHELRLEQLDRRHLVEQQAPRVALAQVDLLQVLVEPPLGEQVVARREILRHERHLRELGRARDADERRRARGERRDARTAACRSGAAPRTRRAGAATCAGRRSRRRRLGLEHVAVEVGRAPHGLARVVDDEVEPAARVAQVLAERLDARRVAQVEPEDLEPVAPLLEVGLLRVARRSIAREARRDDQLRTRAQQLDARLVADLDATAREQRDAAPQVGGLGALAVVEVAAGRAELVVERVDLEVALLADVAVLRLDRLAELGVVLDLGLRELRRARTRSATCRRASRAARGCRSRRARPRRSRAGRPWRDAAPPCRTGGGGRRPARTGRRPRSAGAFDPPASAPSAARGRQRAARALRSPRAGARRGRPTRPGRARTPRWPRTEGYLSPSEASVRRARRSWPRIGHDRPPPATPTR